MTQNKQKTNIKKRRSTVEAQFGILKISYNYNNLRTHRIQHT